MQTDSKRLLSHDIPTTLNSNTKVELDHFELLFTKMTRTIITCTTNEKFLLLELQSAAR